MYTLYTSVNNGGTIFKKKYTTRKSLLNSDKCDWENYGTHSL